jgi:hypothetical protein
LLLVTSIIPLYYHLLHMDMSILVVPGHRLILHRSNCMCFLYYFDEIPQCYSVQTSRLHSSRIVPDCVRRHHTARRHRRLRHCGGPCNKVRSAISSLICRCSSYVQGDDQGAGDRSLSKGPHCGTGRALSLSLSEQVITWARLAVQKLCRGESGDNCPILHVALYA